MNDTRSEHDNRLITAYNRMIERVRARFDQAEQDAMPTLQRSIEEARDRAVELGELGREEADRIASYVQRDLQDAGGFLAESGSDLAAWLRFDLELIEDRLLDMFAAAADRTKLELLQLEQEAREAPQYHTGEITGPGTLQCAECDKLIHFHHTARIPTCPRCHNTEFRRVLDRETGTA